MEAFVVAPAPPQARSSKSSPHTEPNGGESSFAPRLTKAIDDNAKLQETQDSRTAKNIDSGTEKSAVIKEETGNPSLTKEEEPEGIAGSGIPDESILPFGIAQHVPPAGQPQTRVDGLPAQFSSADHAAVNGISISGKHGVPTQSYPNTLPSPADRAAVKETSISEKHGFPSQSHPHILTSPADHAAVNGILTSGNHRFTIQPYPSTLPSSADQGSALIQSIIPADISTSAGLRNGAGETSIFNFGSSAMAAKPAAMTPSQPLFQTQKAASALNILQNNDSISLSPGNERVPTSLLQNNLLLPTAEIPSGPAAPSLSAEKIIAGLTEIPAQLKGMSLRDNGLSLRREINSPQLFEAQIQNLDSGNSRHNSQQFLDSDSEAPVQPTLSSNVKPGESSESSFSQSLSNLSTDKGQTLGETMRPGTLTFTQSTHENAVLQQVAQKFRVIPNLQDSKLVLKLHPAELGSMKIDIQLKDGSISASILAQSRNVMEILEKNLPRLKALMEEQGLSVGEISINLDSDVPEDHNLFEDQLAREDTSFSNPGNSHSDLSFELEPMIEEGDIAGISSQPGVNVKI